MALTVQRVGLEFLVNTQTMGVQAEPTITGLANGGFVVSWTDGSGTLGDTSASSIKAQIFSADGARVGAEFLVNTQTANSQEQPTITGLSNGGFVVSWADDSGALGVASGPDIRAQIFSAAGVKVGVEFLVNTQIANSQDSTTITGLNDGGFVASWTDYSGSLGDTSLSSIKAQVFSADGAKVGAEFLVNTQTANHQLQPAITGLSNGGFVVSWMDESGTLGDVSASSVKAQIFNADGAKVGAEFLVNTQISGYQYLPAATSLSNGGFVVSWTDLSGTLGDGSGHSIKAQVFSADGAKVGAEFLVNTQTDGSQYLATINSLSSGGFVVSWMDTSETFSDGSGYSIKAQMFGSDGTRIGAEFLVNTQIADNQVQPAVTGLISGGFVVSWYDGSGTLGDPSGSSIKAQIFGVTDTNAAPTGHAALVLPNGVEDTPYDVSCTALLTGYSDADGDTLQVTGLTADHGTVATNPEGSFRITPETGYAGPVMLNYSVTDGHGGAVAGVQGFTLTDAYGTEGPDSYAGTAGGDTFSALGGADSLNGAAGNDLLDGGEGADTLQGAGDNDTLRGGGGEDQLYGATGNDSLSGGWGDDMLQGGIGDDTLDGGANNAVVQETRGHVGGDFGIYVDAASGVTVSLAVIGPQAVGGGLGLDTLINIENLFGGSFDDRLTGDDADNYLGGGFGADTLTGGGGVDILEGGPGNDRLVGGAGVDAAVYNTATSGVVVDLATGQASGGGLGVDTLVEIEAVVGSQSNDTLSGDADANRLEGQGGADSLSGGAGNDEFVGGAGDDTISGGEGDDLAIFAGNFSDYAVAYDNIGGRIQVAGPDGNDVLTGVNRLQFADQIITAVMPGVVNPGSAGDDTLAGGEGRDSLSGGIGADNLVGGAGIDTLSGGAGNDSLGGGGDADSVSGADGNDRIEGGGGDDLLVGGRGTDLFVFGTGFGHDTVTDFRAVEDDIRFEGGVFSSFSDVIAHAAQVGANVVITDAAGDVLQLNNVTLSSLTTADFLFA